MNVVLLDNGYASDGTKHSPRVLRYYESLSDLRNGSSNWTEEVLRTIPTGSWADQLRVVVIPDCRLEILVDGNDHYQLVPEFLEAAMR